MNWCLLDAMTPQDEVRPNMVDLFVFIQGLHAVKDRRKFFANVANLMKPTTRLILCDFFFNSTGLKEEEMGLSLRIVKSVEITQ